MDSPDVQLPVPQQEERTLAMLAHILQVFVGFIAPLVILVVKRQSRFVSFHAVQALLWQVIYFVIAMLAMVAWFAVVFSIALAHSGSSSNPQPAEVFLAFPLMLLFLMAGWATGLVLAIVYGIKASNGEWAEYPLIGRWARRLTLDSARGAPLPTAQP
ncbi:MAG TPA: DUF4870 domain-containing protein [Terriglobia bacterium]|nr:DUF4870 domain-containing protein [Terriglobia bacterium]